MPLARIASVLLAALLPFSGCGGCNEEPAAPARQATKPAGPSAQAPTPTTTTLPAVAHDGKYTLYRGTGWKVGSVVTSDASTTTNKRFTQVKADGGSTAIPEQRQTIRATWAERAAEVDADGHRTKYLVVLRAWSRTSDRQRDKSLEGATLSVSGRGGERTWTITTAGFEPSDEAKSWLDEHFGTRGLDDEQWLRLVLPEENVKPGTSWRTDPTLLGGYFAGLGMPVDRSSAQATVTLKAIEGGLARCAIEGSVALPPAADAGDASKGGTLAFDGTMTLTLEPAPLFLSSTDSTVTVQGDTVQDGHVIRYDVRTVDRRTTTPGGDFPAQ